MNDRGSDEAGRIKAEAQDPGRTIFRRLSRLLCGLVRLRAPESQNSRRAGIPHPSSFIPHPSSWVALGRGRFAVAAALNWLIAVLMFGVGVVYLAATEIMPYHRQILGVPWNNLPEGGKLLILVFMKGTGWVGISTAVSLAVLLLVPFRRHEPWSRWAILLVGGTAVVPMLAGAIFLRLRAGYSAPLWPHAALCVALGAGFLLSGNFEGGRMKDEG